MDDPEPPVRGRVRRAPARPTPARLRRGAVRRPGRHAHRPVGPVRPRWAAGRTTGCPPTLQGRVAADGPRTWRCWRWWSRPPSRSTAGGRCARRARRVLPVAAPVRLALVAAADAGGCAGGLVRPGAARAATAAGSARDAGGSIVVDVAGKVRRPGIATLPLGSRVVDALEAAGGPGPGSTSARSTWPGCWPTASRSWSGCRAARVAASAAGADAGGGLEPRRRWSTSTPRRQAELETLPGVGPVTAQAILTWRTEQRRLHRRSTSCSRSTASATRRSPRSRRSSRSDAGAAAAATPRGRGRPTCGRSVLGGVAPGPAALAASGCRGGPGWSCVVLAAVALSAPAAGAGGRCGRCWPACWRLRGRRRRPCCGSRPTGAARSAALAARAAPSVTVAGAGDRRTRCCGAGGSGRSCSPGCRCPRSSAAGAGYGPACRCW